MLPLELKDPLNDRTASTWAGTIGALAYAPASRKLAQDSFMRTRYILEMLAAVPVLVCFLRWLGVVLMAMRRGRARRCPRCHCDRTRWSMLQLRDKILPAFVMPRRCESCQNRFYAAHSVNYVRRARLKAASASLPAPRPAGGLVTATLQSQLR